MSISITSVPNTDSSGNITVTTTPSSDSLNTATTVFKSNEFAISVKTETTLTAVSYTVTTGKSFYLLYFGSSLTASFPCIFRFKVNGVIKVTNVATNDNTVAFNITKGIQLANSGDVITVTYDPQAAKGTGWVGFIGLEQ
jgi:hypothetical protein